jgi:hypothetical protein
VIRRQGGIVPVGGPRAFTGVWQPQQEESKKPPSPSVAPTREELRQETERLEVLERSASSPSSSSDSSKASATDGKRERRLKQLGGLRKRLGQLTAGSPPSSPGSSDSEGWSDADENAGDVGRGPAGTGELPFKAKARQGGAGGGEERSLLEKLHVSSGEEKGETSSSGETSPRATLSGRLSATATGRRAASPDSLASEEDGITIGSLPVGPKVLKHAEAERPTPDTTVPAEVKPATGAGGEKAADRVTPTSPSKPEPEAALETVVEVAQLGGGSESGSAESGSDTLASPRAAEAPRSEPVKGSESATSQRGDLAGPAAAEEAVAASPQLLTVEGPREARAATTPGASLVGQVVLEKATSDSRDKQSKPLKLVIASPRRAAVSAACPARLTVCRQSECNLR